MSTNQIEAYILQEQSNLQSLYSLLCITAFKFVNDTNIAETIVQKVYIDCDRDGIDFENQERASEYFYNTVTTSSQAYAKENNIPVIREISKAEFRELKERFMHEEVYVICPNLIDNILDNFPSDEADSIKRSIEDYS